MSNRGGLNFDFADDVYLGLPGDGDTLELTVDVGRTEPEQPPYAPGDRDVYRICFVADPDGYRTELIDGAFPTPQDPPHSSRSV